jgi:hypothetical protein
MKPITGIEKRKFKTIQTGINSYTVAQSLSGQMMPDINNGLVGRKTLKIKGENYEISD